MKANSPKQSYAMQDVLIGAGAQGSGAATSAYKASQIVKGTWQLAGGHGAVDDSDTLAGLFRCAELGITTFDTADIYSGAEVILGRFLRE
jgi:aryl-alcohol dehydrogenase-like predicted oxidoreductase